MSNETAIASLKEKIDDLNQHAWEVRVTDLPKSFEFSQESVKLARSINYPKGLAEGLRSLGFSYVRYSKNDEAAPLLKESLSLYQSLNDLKGQAVVYEYLGIIERNWGNLGASLELLLKANELILQTGPPEVEITCSYQLGVTYKHLGNHENALDYLYKTLSLAKKINLPLMEAYATNIIGSIYFDNGNYNQALDCYQQGLPIRQQSHDKWGEAGSLDNIGFTYLKLNHLDKAIEYCKQSLAICQGTGDKKGEANTLLHLAEIYEQAGDVKQAAGFSNESLAIRKDRGDKRGETEVLLFLADLYKNRNDVEDHQIFEWLSGALKIADEIKAQDLLSKAYYNLHEYYQQKGNFKESLVQLEAHFQIEKELHKNSINQKVANLEISHKAEVVSQRNKELTELNEKIEKANEELKIERSLERVRATAMAMKGPADMLEVCKIISDQLEILDVKKVRNVQTAIFYEEKNAYTNYEYYAKHDKLLITEVDYNNHPVAEKFANQMLKGPNQVWTHGFKGEEVKDWLNYQRSTNVFIDTHLETADSLNYYWYSLGPVALGMSTYAPLSENEIDLFKRFRNVFELAYRRYLDIEKAEAQAREAQIELALERVRAKTMAMHHSGELAETASVLFQQIKELGFETWSCGFCTWTKDDLVEVWMAADSGGLLPPMMIPYKEEPTHSKIYEASLGGETAHDKVWEGKELEKHYAFLKSIPSVKEAIEILERSGLSLPSRQCYYVGFFKQGYLLLITKETNADLKDLSRRFAKVFEQTYTRFLDLQKAEAQAREAQIEAALERIRSASLAMHKTDDLKNVVKVLFEQLQELSIEMGFGSVSIYIFNRDTRNMEQWLALPDAVKLLHIPYFEHPILSGLFEAKERGDDFFAKIFPVELKNSWTEKGFEVTDYKYLPEEFKAAILDAPGYSLSVTLAKNSGIAIPNFHGKLLSKEDNEILKRVGKVFEQSYTRFLDLQKAEAQTREAKIEVALERARTQSMIMQHSKELDDTLRVFHEQVLLLGIKSAFSFLWLPDEDKDRHIFWAAWSEYNSTVFKSKAIAYPLDRNEPATAQCLVDWKGKEPVVSYHVPPAGVENYFAAWQELIAGVEQLKPEYFSDGLYYVEAFLKYGCFGVMVESELSEDEKKILSRFAVEFERTYTRFLDLQKAEAQAREAQVELGLERVRARAMAMQNSEELNDLVAILFEELTKLDLKLARCIIWIFDNEELSARLWMANSEDKKSAESYYIKRLQHFYYEAVIKGWKERNPKWVYDLKGDEKKTIDKLLLNETELSRLPDAVKNGILNSEHTIISGSFNNFGLLEASGPVELSAEQMDIVSRFAKVFDLTYTRFNDLKQAEAQTRESQIELGLERVRAKAMAMQRSDELKELIGTVYNELTKLDLILDRCFIMIYDNRSLGVTWWMSNPEASSQPIGLFVKYHEQPPYQAFIKGWKERNLKWQYVLEGEVKKTWDKFLFVETELSQLPDFVIANMKANEKVYLSASFNNFGCLTLATLESLSDEHFDIMLRFAKVFDLTYTRFNDLKQAEAQAREAKIEAALERVRAKAMAMHKSEDLNPAVATVFEELDKLNIGILRCGIAIMDKEKPRGDVWITVKSEHSNTIQVSGDESLDYHPLLRGAYDGWLKQEDFSYVLQGDDLVSYYRDVASMKYQLPVSTSFDTEKKDQQQYYYNAVFQDGSLFAFMETAITDEAQTVIKRFANVFNLTYKRFLDLQKAEAQTREAKIEAALERVRARALAMQEPEELKDVAQVLRSEMGELGVEELETCSIYINDEATNKTECWYALKDSREEGRKLVSDHFPLNLNDTWVGREMKFFYGSDAKQVSIVMQGADRKEWINYCEERSIPLHGYYGEVIPDRTYHLYKFSHGAIGAAAAGDISAESWKLLSRAASVFSLAYSRFKDLTQARNDLIQLKEEKKRAEEALRELQATQKQLIQAEKMASLGELTAGIAHEIQNPLNFVNNFSDVSHELLEEMKTELEKGNAEGAKEIAIDVKENLEKILHHGKRADAIVKGMLQHSRSSSGQKELTDVNILAEEYLRLAYHGLRAKDKFFNAKFETDLDPSITKINIVPQEIGRVILNLINNAFYAVSEKKNAPPPPEGGIKDFQDLYEPTVKVKTLLTPPSGGRGAAIEIRVMDNGNGIPKKVLDKIFQPFFTTKPTGQGTGLGLSLSYDIVTKGHDGEIKVETKEGEGSAFTISLPMK